MEQAAVTTPVSTRLTPSAVVRALRPDEWVKTLFVFAALLFGRQFDLTSALEATGAFVAFCAVASAGYIVNDIRDIELDRRHPEKRSRAIASGQLAAAAHSVRRAAESCRPCRGRRRSRPHGARSRRGSRPAPTRVSQRSARRVRPARRAAPEGAIGRR